MSNAPSSVRVNTLTFFDNELPSGFISTQDRHEIALEMIGFNRTGLTSKYVGVQCLEIEPVINTDRYDSLLHIFAVKEVEEGESNTYQFVNFKKIGRASCRERV